MKKLLCLLFFFVSISVHSQILKNSGVVVGIGKGGASYDLPHYAVDNPTPIDQANSYFKGRVALELGYKFRLQPGKSRFFYDVGVLGGYNNYKYNVNFMPLGNAVYAGSSGTKDIISFSAFGTANYEIYKGLSVGVGVQPTYSVWDEKRFDVPISVQLAYDFKCVELGVSYKQGLTKNLKVSSFENTRVSQLLVSLYVPLFKNK